LTISETAYPFHEASGVAYIYSIPPLLTATLLIALAALALLRTGNAPSNRLFGLLCLLGGVLYVDILVAFNASSDRIALWSNRCGHLIYPFLIPLFIHFVHRFLGIDRRRWLLQLAYLFATVLALFALGDGMVAGVRRFTFGYMGLAGRFYPLMAAGAVIATTYNLVLLQAAIRDERRAEHRNRLRYLLAGFGGLGVLSSLNFLPLFGYPLYPPGNFGFIPMTVLAAGLFRHDLLDMGLLWRKGLLFSLLTACLTALYAVVIALIPLLFRGHRLTESLLFPLLLFVLITFIFGPLKKRAQSAMERRFARGRYDYQKTIKRVSRCIAAVLDYATIARLLRETIIDAMQVEKGTLMVRSGLQGGFVSLAAVGDVGDGGDGLKMDLRHPVVRRLETAVRPLIRRHIVGAKRPHDQVENDLVHLGAEIVLAMRFEERINGILILGEKRSGDAYTPQDIDLLETLCAQSALAIENARVYQALNALNQTLERKVATRTQELEAALIEKERTQEQLIRSESLAALGQLVAGVAHELNNPLTSVTSLLQSTMEDLQHWNPAQPPHNEWIDDLRFADRELARAKSIVGSLLGLARQTQTYAESVDINGVILDALRLLHNQSNYATVKIEQDLEVGLPGIHGNFSQLGQVAMNLLKNAIDAVSGKADGLIVVRSRYLAGTHEILFACEDNGCGIPETIRKDVFKPFFTTKPVGQGTGLGLYICHGIVQKHGGTIQLEPTRPCGTLVTVKLPLDSP
jgi:two-component system, NtrC family, sensor kinase